MMSGQQIVNISREAAARASREDRVPLIPWDSGELRLAPFLGDYIPPGWRAATWADIEPLDRPRGSSWWHGEQATLFIDSSGFGGRDEPALSIDEADVWLGTLLAHKDTRTTFGVGIVQAGQFQVYVGLYVKDDSAPGNPVEDEDFGLCLKCGEEDGEFDYHECGDDNRDEFLSAYIVTLANGQQYRFMAEDADHAREQAENAEPGNAVKDIEAEDPDR